MSKRPVPFSPFDASPAKAAKADPVAVGSHASPGAPLSVNGGHNTITINNTYNNNYYNSGPPAARSDHRDNFSNSEDGPGPSGLGAESDSDTSSDCPSSGEEESMNEESGEESGDESGDESGEASGGESGEESGEGGCLEADD